MMNECRFLKRVKTSTSQRHVHSNGLNGTLSNQNRLSKMEKRKCCPSQPNKKDKGIWETCGMSVHARHLFNKTTQYSHFGYLRDNLQRNECIVHIDFSEKFVGKMHREIQDLRLVRLRCRSLSTLDVITLQEDESCFVAYAILCSLTLPLLDLSLSCS